MVEIIDTICPYLNYVHAVNAAAAGEPEVLRNSCVRFAVKGSDPFQLLILRPDMHRFHKTRHAFAVVTLGVERLVWRAVVRDSARQESSSALCLRVSALG